MLLKLSLSVRLFTAFLFFCVFSNNATFAQSTTSLPTIKNKCSFAGNFIQTKSLAGLPDPIQSSGSFYHHCEHGVIWKTTKPIINAFIFRKVGQSYSINDQEIKPIKTKHSKFIGRLIFNLMQSNNANIEKHFNIQKINDETLTLSPASRSLKKGIKNITLKYLHANKTPIKLLGPDPISPSAIDISILDRNNEATRIITSQSNIYSSNIETTVNCLESSYFSTTECELLLKHSLKQSETY